jgi:hypothetical protein
MKIRNQLFVTIFTIVAASAWALFNQSASADDPVVFTDNFSGSTVNQTSTPGGTPAASSTSYDFVSTKAATSTISAGDLDTVLPSTGSGLVEAQAVFTSTPLVLATTGDYVDFTIEFTDTANIANTASSGNQLWIGLFNSGKIAPLTGEENSGAGQTTGGGVQTWTGYTSALFTSGTTSSKMYDRPSQNTAAGNQDLFGNGTGSDTDNGPKGTQLVNGTATSTVLLTNGNQYTEDFRITLTGAGQLTANNTLYAGAGTGGTLLFSQTGYSNNVPSTTFDSLGFGWYQKASLVSTEDVSFIQITSSVPEPSTWMLLTAGLGIVFGLVGHRRRRVNP